MLMSIVFCILGLMTMNRTRFVLRNKADEIDANRDWRDANVKGRRWVDSSMRENLKRSGKQRNALLFSLSAVANCPEKTRTNCETENWFSFGEKINLLVVASVSASCQVSCFFSAASCCQGASASACVSFLCSSLHASRFLDRVQRYVRWAGLTQRLAMSQPTPNRPESQTFLSLSDLAAERR